MNQSNKSKYRFLIAASIGVLVTLQGCAFAPKQQHEPTQRSALLRWNQCLERFDSNLAHYCDGHRRDVLASFPLYMENQVDKILSEKMRVLSASRLVKSDQQDMAPLINALVRFSSTNATVEASNDDL